MKVLCVLVIGCVLVGIAGCGKRTPDAATQKWQYCTIRLKTNLEKLFDNEIKTDSHKAFQDRAEAKEFPAETDDGYLDLSKMGDEGWELVAAIPENETVFTDRGPNVRPHGALLIFKRPL